MRNFLGFVLASTLATGCIITTDDDPDPVPPGGVCGDGATQSGEQCDDGNNVSGDGCSATCTSESAGDAVITAGWSFRNAIDDNPANDQATSCPSGYNTIAHYNQELDAGTGAPVGQPVIDLYDCVDGTNFTDGLPAGIYQTWLESTTDDGSGVYAQSLSAIVDVTTQDASFEAAIFNNAGYFLLGWTLKGANTNQPLTCAQAGATEVDITSTVSGGSAAATDLFNCEDGSGITARLLEGSYTVSVAAASNAGALGEPQNVANQIIQAPNRVTDLGAFVLPIDGQ